MLNKVKKVLATPVARKMAKDLGVDIGTVRGSGPVGRVLKADIQNAFDALREPSVKVQEEKANPNKSDVVHGHSSYVPKEPEDLIERVPMSMIRKTIAANMTKSKYTIPHTSVMDEVDVTDLVEYRTKNKSCCRRRRSEAYVFSLCSKSCYFGAQEA